MHGHSRSAQVFLTWSWVLLLGCSEQKRDEKVQDPTKAVAGPGSLPDLVPIEGGSTKTGFAIGTLRRSEHVDSFRITKHPITVRDFKMCVDTGACAAASASSCTARERRSLSDADIERDSVPVVCVPPVEANRYCAWIGGRLPTLSEWLLAARGPAVRRYSWGNDGPTCDQHRGGSTRGATGVSGACVSTAEERHRALDVGKHPGGASPLGVEDVLLTPAELIAGSSATMVRACGALGGACVAYGLTPGAIDAVAAVPQAGAAKGVLRGLGPDPAYGFRCALETLQ